MMRPSPFQATPALCDPRGQFTRFGLGLPGTVRQHYSNTILGAKSTLPAILG